MAERSKKSDEIGQRTPRPKRDGKIQTDSATEETLDNDENIVSAPKALRSQDFFGQGANVDVENINEMAIRTSAPEGSPEVSRTERSIDEEVGEVANVEAENVNEVAIRTAAPEGSPDTSRTARSIDEEFGSNDAVPRETSDKRKDSRRKKKRRRTLKKKTEYVHLGGGSLSEIAIRTKNGDDISRTEITITFSDKADKGVERSAYSNEVAQRTPAPEGTSDFSRTERSIGEHFGSKRKRGRSSKKKKSSKRKKGSKKQQKRKKRASLTQKTESTEFCVCCKTEYCMCCNELAIRTPAPEGSPAISRTEKSIGFESSVEDGRSSVKKKKSKVRKSSKKRKVQRSKGVTKELKEPTQYGGAAASEVAIRTEAPLGKGPLVSETEKSINSACSVYSNELAIRTPGPEGSPVISRTETSIGESGDEGERSSVKKKIHNVKKRSKKHKMRRRASTKSKGFIMCGGSALSEVAIRTESPLGKGQPSETEKSIDSACSVYSNEVAIRTAAPEGSGAISKTELSLSDVSGSSFGVDLPLNKKEQTKGKSVSKKKQRKRASTKKKSFRLGGSPSEVAIKTEAPLGKSPAVSQTEKTIESRPGSAFENEVAIRTPVPNGSPDLSRTERSVGKPFHGDKRSSKKKKKERKKGKKRSAKGKGSSKEERKKKSKKKRSSKSKKSSVKLDLRRSKRSSTDKNKGIDTTLNKSAIRTPSPLRKSEVLSGTQTLGSATNLEQSSAAAKVEERDMPVEMKHKDERQESPTDAETNKKLPKRGSGKSSRRKLSSKKKRRKRKPSKDAPPSQPPEKQPDSTVAKVEDQNESAGEKDKGVGLTEAETKSTKSQREKATPKQGDE